ncbi:MAG: 23S rRNA (adenine(2503)-C(2))-methyltransferase RlmN [Streptococcaceae bacterium]|jgi:23S rRNA (adenine2503-C2)-methyltransferase|nr:23S rRNA (adenine(2503)-C(2))-methyltransferase RlmN [Streptococcaceae bacterium]
MPRKELNIGKPSIYGLPRTKLAEWVLEAGEKKYRAEQIWDWLYRQRVASFDDMTNLPQTLVEKLAADFVLNPLKQVVVQESTDGTVKYLFQLPDKMMIETVLMRQPYGLSVCVTTQVGCDMGCTFCASGILRKERDVTAGEIVSQIMLVQKYFDEKAGGFDGERVSHVVVMGIGEPFDNYENLMDFLHVINDDKGLAIGARHITVSTCGFNPQKIRDFANEEMQVNLAISLHAPNNTLRTELMRINRAQPLDKLFDAIDYYTETTNRRVTYEYIMLDQTNDTPELAQELAALIKPRNKLAYVNMIPYNKVAEHITYEQSEHSRILAFYDVLKKNGVNCVVRVEHGADIDAACGQLRSKQIKMEKGTK